MSNINFLPEYGTWTKVTEQTTALPVEGKPDLIDPNAGYKISPHRVEITVRRHEAPDGSFRLWESVIVYGQRVLKAGGHGKREVSCSGWENASNSSYLGIVEERPQWLTDLLALHAPELAAKA